MPCCPCQGHCPNLIFPKLLKEYARLVSSGSRLTTNFFSLPLAASGSDPPRKPDNLRSYSRYLNVLGQGLQLHDFFVKAGLLFFNDLKFLFHAHAVIKECFLLRSYRKEGRFCISAAPPDCKAFRTPPPRKINYMDSVFVLFLRATLR